MPTDTFFRLPEEKRARILESAWSEFTAVPYAEASINRIVQTSRIPRGSFYQYFEDKNDLFLTLIDEIRDQFLDLFHDTLERERMRGRIEIIKNGSAAVPEGGHRK